MKQKKVTVTVYEGKKGFYWRKQRRNNRITADGGQAYTRRDSAVRAAKRENPGAEIVHKH